MKNTDKKKELKNYISDYKKINNTILELLYLSIGSKIDVSKIFSGVNLSDDIKKLSFSEKPFEEVREDYETELEEDILLIDTAKKIYDNMILSGIMKESKSISEGKVKLFDKHREDLRDLKKLLNENRRNHPKDYTSVLKSDDKKYNNYLRYVGRSKQTTSCSKENFYKFLKKIITDYPKSTLKEKILREIDLNSYLPLQRTKDNSSIPYQLHKAELEIILEKAASHYPFLGITEDGISNKDKIISLLEFRIPYYVGPLNGYHKKFVWIERKIYQKSIRPWNFNKVVDVEKSAENFITRMTNKCTYLLSEDVLPKESLLYSEFSLLNEVNNITCEGEKLPVNIRNELIDNFFKNPLNLSGKVTIRKIKEWLINKGLANENSIIAGIDKEIKSDLRAYREFKKIFKDNFNNEIVENLIKWNTLFGKTKRILRKKISSEYSNEIISEEQLEKICKLTFKGWGNLSKTFLTKIHSEKMVNDNTGELLNIIMAMRKHVLNLNSLLAVGKGFDEKIEEYNRNIISDTREVSYDLVDELNISPAVKRGVWQTLLLMKEIVKIRGRVPKKIFIEVNRENESGAKKNSNAYKRTSRKEQLSILYEECKNCNSDWIKQLDKENDDRLRSRKLFLYYLQQGKSAYSDEVIDIEELMSGKGKYDIDHIWPRSLTKDDSIDNTVLCLKTENSAKADNYPIDNKIQSIKLEEWKSLNRNGLMSDKKFQRLTRTKGLTGDELAGFIARQIVATNQTIKAVAAIIKRIYSDSDVVYVKSGHVSEYRYAMNDGDKYKTGLYHKYVKVRSINDFHHAKDAYLNVVVGNVYDCKFTRNPYKFIENTAKEERSLTALYKHTVKSGNYIAWKPGSDGTQAIVDKEMKSNDVRITKKVCAQKAELHDANPRKASEITDSMYLPLKNDERYRKMGRYGAYPSIKTAYYSIYKYIIVNKLNRKKTIIKIGFIPLVHAKRLESDENKLEYFRNSIELKPGESIKKIEIIYPRLRMNTKVKIDGMYYRLGGKSNETITIDNAVPLVLSNEFSEYIKRIEKELNPDITKKFNDSKKITEEMNEKLFDEFREKLSKTIYAKRKSFKHEVFDSDTTKEKFKKLSEEEQAKALLDILNVITNQKSTLNLKIIGMNTSRATIGANLINLKEFSVIEESITGLYEKEILIIGESK